MVVACGGARVANTPKRAPPVEAGVVTLDAAVEAGPNKLEVLAAKHDTLARGMREILRREVDAAHESEIALPHFEADTCIRVAFDADAPTVVDLKTTMTVASLDAAEGALGPSGPVCFRRTDAAVIHFTGQSHVNVVVWASP
jgi:hypothetical protein